MKQSIIYSYIRLMCLDKPIGIFLLLWPTLMALWIAGEGSPDPYVVGIFVMGVIIMRSAGCIINDIADKDFDKAVARTKNRPLPKGELLLQEALLLFFLLLSVALLLVLQLNLLTIELSFIGVFLAALYPFMKRYIPFPQVVLGAAFGWAVPMAFAALTYNPISTEAILLYLFTLCWTVAYDTEYAMVDRLDDIQIGVKSTAIWFGRQDRLMIGILQLGALGLLTNLGQRLALGNSYFIGIFCSSLLILYQQYLIKDRDREHCFKAFLNNNLLGAILFIGLVLAYY